VRLVGDEEVTSVEIASRPAVMVGSIPERDRSSAAEMVIVKVSPTLTADADEVAERIAGGASTWSVSGRSTGAEEFPPKSLA
jgi:hypothetical protein